MCSASVKLFMGAKDDIKPCPGPVGWALAHAAGGLKPTLRVHGAGDERRPRRQALEDGLLDGLSMQHEPAADFVRVAVVHDLVWHAHPEPQHLDMRRLDGFP